jgi:hypothetical protein
MTGSKESRDDFLDEHPAVRAAYEKIKQCILSGEDPTEHEMEIKLYSLRATRMALDAVSATFKVANPDVDTSDLRLLHAKLQQQDAELTEALRSWLTTSGRMDDVRDTSLHGLSEGFRGSLLECWTRIGLASAGQ